MEKGREGLRTGKADYLEIRINPMATAQGINAAAICRHILLFCIVFFSTISLISKDCSKENTE